LLKPLTTALTQVGSNNNTAANPVAVTVHRFFEKFGLFGAAARGAIS